jgi:biopolymer transport protein ExbD
MRPRHSKPSRLFCRIDVSAFASVAVFLLAVFMVTTGPTHQGTSYDLPKVGHAVPMPRANREDALLITVLRDGMTYFQNSRVVPDNLLGMIRDGVNRGAEQKVYIRADARARYGTVAAVLDAVHAAGVEKVTFSVGQRRVLSASPDTSPTFRTLPQ